MSRLKAHFCLIGLTLMSLASAQAQEFVDKGLYAVARAGGMANPSLKFDTNALTALMNGEDTVKYKRAPFGEIGGGYNFGGVRVEETLGYSSSDARIADAGRARLFSLTLSGFADIPVSAVIVPYVGGGMGAVRIDSSFSWSDANTGDRFQSRSWGPFWHVDAGVGFHMSRRITIELGGRYVRSLSMKRLGHGSNYDLVPVSGYEAAIVTLGLRYAF